MISEEMVRTSVRLLPESVEVLESTMIGRGCSRDQAIRDLLGDYLWVQQEVAPNDRLTHVTAVLRYPPLPPGRNQSDGRVRIPVRLHADTMEKVAGLTLRLPGQPRRRGLKDYTRSPLAEALTTALARVRPFDVPGLAGLPQIWTQSAAIGLWRLAVAATLTVPEQQGVLGELDDFDHTVEDATALTHLLRDGDLAWHHPWRYAVALRLARNLLIGSEGPQYFGSLKRRDDVFEELRFDLERTDDLDHDVLRGAPRNAITAFTGRGGSLVWRARRSLALQAIREWIVSHPTEPLIVSPPHARIVHPPEWTSIRVPTAEPLPAEVLADVEAGKVLQFSTGQYTSAWPYLRKTMTAVPQFDVVIEELRRSPEEVVELALIDDQRLSDVYLDPAVAYEVGFLTADERDLIVQEASKHTAQRIDWTLARAAKKTPAAYPELVAVREDPEEFFKLARKHHHGGGGVVRPWWVWQAGALNDELEKLATTPDRLRLLVSHRGGSWKRQLETAMQLAGRAAIARGYQAAQVPDAHDAEWGIESDEVLEFDLDNLLD